MRKAGAAYVQTILEIMEDKAPFMISRWFYCIMIMIVFHQDAGYFFSTYERTALNEPKMAFIAHLNEISPGTFLLYYKGNDQLTLIMFVLMQILSYSYFTYVGVLTYLKQKSSGKRKLHSFVKKYKETKSGERQQSKQYIQSSKSTRQTNENNQNDSEAAQPESDQHNSQSKLIKGINQILNVFFTFYYWVFFTPFVEINSGVFVCGGNSFLIQYRDNADLCDQKPILLKVFPIIGLALTLTTGFIVVYLFRSYEFHDQNLLKRRFYTSLFFQLLCRFFLIFCYYLNISVSLVTKHILASCLGVLAIYDSISSISFSDKTVALFFGCAATVFEISVVLCHLWIFTNEMPAREMFYYFVILSVAMSGAVVQTMKVNMEGAMRLNHNNYSHLYKKTDFYLEEFVRMILDGRKDEYCKFKLEEIIIFHQLECNDPTCYCHSQDMKVLQDKQLLSGPPAKSTTTFTTLQAEKSEKFSQKTEQQIPAYGKKPKASEQAHTKRFQFQNKSPSSAQNMLSEKELKDRAFKIVDSIFKWALSSPQLQQDTSEFEHLSLKYISYLAKYRQNTFRAYYELKALLFGRLGVSFYFKMISKIMSRSIETQIKQEEMMNHSKDEKDDLPVWVVWKMDSLKDRFVPAIARALESKNEFWRGLQNGFTKMEDCVEFCEKQSTILRSLNSAFESELNELDNQVKHTFVFFKIMSIFELLIHSQPTPAAKYDKICHELIKRDVTISANGLNNSSIANKQIATIMISFSKNPGRIISKIPNSLRTIFKFSKGDALTIKNVNQLMPKILGSVHNELLMNSNNRGAPSPYVGTIKASCKNIQSFCVDKQGYIFAAKTFVGNSFGHIDDFCFVGSVLKIQNNLEYMLFDQTGQIQGISQILFKRLFQSKNSLYSMTLSELLKSGYAFLFCQSILQSIRDDIENEILGDQLASGIIRRASINVTSHFSSVFKRFHNFLEIKKIQPNILDYSSMKQLLNDFSRMKMRRLNSHNSSHHSNQNIAHTDHNLNAWWVGLTYSLRYQEIKYQEGTKSIQLFNLAVQDISEESQDNPKSINQSQDVSQTEFDFSNTKTSFKLSQTTLTEGFTIGEFAQAAQNQDIPSQQQIDTLEVQRNRDRLLKGIREDETISISKHSPRQQTIESLSQNARINYQTANQGLIHKGSSTRDMSDSRALSFVHELINEQSKQNNVGMVNNNNNDNFDNEGEVDPAIGSSLKNSMGQSIHRKYQKIGGQSLNETADNKKQTPGGVFNQSDLLTQGQLIQGNNNNNSQNTNNFTTNNFFQTNQINTEDEQGYQQQQLQQQQQQIPLFDYIFETQRENQIAQNYDSMQYAPNGFFQTDREGNYTLPTTRRDNQQPDEQDRIVNADINTESKQPEQNEFTMNDNINNNNKNQIYNVESLINNHEQENYMKRIDLLIHSNNNQDDIQEINQINGFPQQDIFGEQNNQNPGEQKVLPNAINSSNSMKSKSLDYNNTQNIQRLKQGKGQNLEDQGSIGSHQSRASRTGQEFIKDILNKNNLPIAAKMYFQTMGLIILILLGSVLWSAIFISIEIKGLSGDLNQLVAYSDIDVAFKRCLVGGIKSNVARLYASTDLAISTEELAVAQVDITTAVSIFSKDLLQLQDQFEGYSTDIAMYSSEYLKQTMLMTQNGLVLLQLSNEAVLQMSYNSDLSVVSAAVRSILFLSQNYFSFSNLTQQLRLVDSSRITNDLDTIDMMTYISAIISTLLCLGVALAGYPLIARISNYKERIVLLVSRISAIEIETEIEKQKECISQLTSSDETFLTDDFFEIVYERKRRRIIGQEVKLITPKRGQQDIHQMKKYEIDQINQMKIQTQQDQEQLGNGNNNNKNINESGQLQLQLQGWQNDVSLAKKEQSEVILTQDSNIKERSNHFKDPYDQQINRDINIPSSSYRLQSNSLLGGFPKKKVDFKVNLSSQGQQQLQQQELQSFSAARLPQQQQQLQELSEMQINSPQNMLFRSPTYSQSQQLDRQEHSSTVINRLGANKSSKFFIESPQILHNQAPPIPRLPRTTRGQSQSSLGGISINTGSTNIPGKNHKTTRKPNSNNYISSRITEQKLSIVREYIIIGISAFLSGVFFCSLMAYTLLSRSQITTALSLVFNTLNARSAITGYFTDSDILGGFDYILAANSMVLQEKQLTRNMIITHINLQMKELIQYSSETSETIEKLSSNDYSSVLKQLFESDLCTGFSTCTSSQFSYCQLPSDCGDYTTGISGIISQSLDVYSSYSSTLSSVSSPSASDAIEYMHSAKHLKSISKGFLTPDQVFSLFSQISISAASNIIDKIANIRIIVYSVVGPMLLAMVTGIFYHHWKSLKKTLLSLNYLLVVIPSDKLSEEITLHVLKAIKAA